MHLKGRVTCSKKNDPGLLQTSPCPEDDTFEQGKHSEQHETLQVTSKLSKCQNSSTKASRVNPNVPIAYSFPVQGPREKTRTGRQELQNFQNYTPTMAPFTQSSLNGILTIAHASKQGS